MDLITVNSDVPYNNYANMGAFFPIDTLWDEYGSDVKSLFGEGRPPQPLSIADIMETMHINDTNFLFIFHPPVLVHSDIYCTTFEKSGIQSFILLIPGLLSAYWVIILRTFIKSSIPEALFDSARIDGAGLRRRYHR